MASDAASIRSDDRALAQGGDAAAQLRLGLDLICGRGEAFRPDEGAAWVGRAASGGSLPALSLAATLAASGIGRARNWDEAFDLLVAAAQRGAEKAQGQLRLLAGAPKSDDWADLRRRIDLSAWLAPPPRVPICESPRVRTIKNFLPREACAWLIELARGRTSRALMYNPDAKRDEPHPGRTNSVLFVDVTSADVVFALVRARISAAVNIPEPCFEPTQILNYQVGQQIAPHYDFLEKRQMVDMRTGEPYPGQRIVTFLCYLNDEFEGGSTDFPRADVRFRGATGDALFFANVDAQGQPDRASYHAGTPPTSGEKWTLSQWIQNQTFTGVLA